MGQTDLTSTGRQFKCHIPSRHCPEAIWSTLSLTTGEAGCSRPQEVDLIQTLRRIRTPSIIPAEWPFAWASLMTMRPLLLPSGRFLCPWRFLFSWLHSSSLRRVGSSSLTRDLTPASCAGSVKTGHWTTREARPLGPLFGRRGFRLDGQSSLVKATCTSGGRASQAEETASAKAPGWIRNTARVATGQRGAPGPRREGRERLWVRGAG